MESHEIAQVQQVFTFCFAMTGQADLEEYMRFLQEAQTIGPLFHPGLFGGLDTDPNAFERIRLQGEMAKNLVEFRKLAQQLENLGEFKGRQ